MTFFFPELSIEIDWSKRYRPRDKELEGISLGGRPDGLLADKLVEVCLLGGAARWVLIHIEVQPGWRGVCMIITTGSRKNMCSR